MATKVHTDYSYDGIMGEVMVVLANGEWMGTTINVTEMTCVGEFTEDSLDRIEFIMDVEERLGHIDIPDAVWDFPGKDPEDMTLSDLVNRILRFI